MSNQNPARWRERLRRRGFTQLVDEALEVAFSSDDDDRTFPAEEVEETPRLARGIVWSDLVAEMEREWAERPAELPEAA